MNVSSFLALASLALAGCSSTLSDDGVSGEPRHTLSGTSVVTTDVDPATQRVRYDISFYLDRDAPTDIATLERVRIYTTDGAASAEGEKSCPVDVTFATPPADAQPADTSLGPGPVMSFAVRLTPDPAAPWQLGVGGCTIDVAPSLGTNDALKIVDLYGKQKDGHQWHASTSLRGK